VAAPGVAASAPSAGGEAPPNHETGGGGALPDHEIASTAAAELAILDGARSAVAGGDAPRALSILDDYASRFPRGAMGPEATVLRIEALVVAGDHSAAERAARSFLQRNPQSPYARRIETLLRAQNP
jgi:hypothetical protein